MVMDDEQKTNETQIEKDVDGASDPGPAYEGDDEDEFLGMVELVGLHERVEHARRLRLQRVATPNGLGLLTNLNEQNTPDIQIIP